MTEQLMTDFNPVERPHYKDVTHWRDNDMTWTSDREEFVYLINEAQEHTRWLNGFRSSELSTVPTTFSDVFGTDLERENIEEGTGLTLLVGNNRYPISEIGRKSLYNTADISGQSLGRLMLTTLSEFLNECLKVSKSNSLLLLRYGKIMAFHTDKYCIMPIQTLFKVTEEKLKERFGTIIFTEGYHSNNFTQAVWELPNFQNDFMENYYSAIEDHAVNPVNIMPAVRFSASDTATSAVTATPMAMLPSGVCMPVVQGISIKHEHHANGLEGILLYETALQDIFAKFEDVTEAIKKMASFEVEYPVNCLTGICNRLNKSTTMIARKYADAARQEVENLASFQERITMYDIFLCMGECIHAAKKAQASIATLNNIEEAIALIPKMKWDNFDVSGLVAWRK